MTGSNRAKSRRPRASTHPTAPRDNGLQINPTQNSPAIETRPTDLPHPHTFPSPIVSQHRRARSRAGV
jgi:hypothetical protein